jgi:plastocyanin
MRLTVRLTAAATLASAGLLIAPPAPAAHAATKSVVIAHYAFSPAALTVDVGSSITWTNTDTAPHDVTTTSGPVSIHSPTITTGKSWSYTFTVPGSYAYICSIHPDMRATITVRAAPTQSATTRAAAATPVPSSSAAAPPASHRAQRTAPRSTVTSRSTSAAVVATAPTTSAAPVAAVQASATTGTVLKPLLLVAGLVAAVATLCLLMLASRPEDPPDS